ncbi:MAG: antitoxin family protein [Gemmataceae bacterium]|nr:antitoxin family protein [Gemmataceae bacterium]
MSETIEVKFDGHVLIPNAPVDLPRDRTLRIRVEVVEGESPRFAEFLDFATDLPDAPADLAAQHDRHEFESPKQ